MRDSAFGAGSDGGTRPRSGFAKLIAVGGSVACVVAVCNVGAGCHSSDEAKSAPAPAQTEQASSVHAAPMMVGAERGEAPDTAAPQPATDERAVSEDRVVSESAVSQLSVSVDLGSDDALPRGSKLLLELSDVTDKDEPKPLAQHQLDVSGQQGVVDVSISVPARALLAAERVSLTGRIDERDEMRSISPIALLVEGPFMLDGDVAKTQRDDAFEISLSEVPDYRKHHAPAPRRAHVVQSRSADTGTVVSVPGPTSD